jgi:cation diffusion facilitator CzcD-associated flavoprotein CzcO
MGDAGASLDTLKMDVGHGLDYDVIIIGAGLSGIYSLIKMRQLGMRVKVMETGSAVGGTWFWNQYPGARFDSESYSYGYSFSQELLDEWHWTEHFSPQPETLKYINFVCDKFDLRRDMMFNTRITVAHWNHVNRLWELADEKESKYTARFLITAMGPLTQPTLPNIEGVEDFKGEAYHTARWPDEHVPLENKRIAIIGTGATAIQTIQEVVKMCGSLTVFQRTPNWTAPLNNSKISVEEMADIRKRYPDIFKRCGETWNCFIHAADKRKTLSVPKEEREAFWEELYAQPGFGKWLSNFGDIATDQQANDAFSEFMANKIRQRVKDPRTADKLIPKNHGFGTRRVPLETGYYEAFNQQNVRLVDVNETPIEKITEKGIKTATEDFEFDMIIYATGFDAITGAFDAVDFRGVDGLKLTERWAKGPKTFLGLTVQSFPNMFMVMGPHQAFGNIPRSIEYAVGWISDLIQYCKKNGITYVEPTEEGVAWWTEHVHHCAEGLLANNVDSWMTGVNKNLKGKLTRIIARYNGSAVGFRERCNGVAAEDYKRLKIL